MSHRVNVTEDWFKDNNSEHFVSWTREIGIELEGWDFRGHFFNDAYFTFAKESDALAFRLKFGL